MKPIPKVIYQTADEIEQRIRDRVAEAHVLPPGEPRQAILKEIAQLRVYADTKRWLSGPHAGSTIKATNRPT